MKRKLWALVNFPTWAERKDHKSEKLEQWNIITRIDKDFVAYSDHDPVIFIADMKIYNKLHHHHHPSV
jgi:hypothetical protein